MTVVNNKLKSVWEEVVMTCFKIISQNLPGGTEENHKTSEQLAFRLWFKHWTQSRSGNPSIAIMYGKKVRVQFGMAKEKLRHIITFFPTNPIFIIWRGKIVKMCKTTIPKGIYPQNSVIYNKYWNFHQLCDIVQRSGRLGTVHRYYQICMWYATIKTWEVKHLSAIVRTLDTFYVIAMKLGNVT
jgi:hypothetical protein